ncbi:DNA polymerase kappa-like isoform X1 [Acipenser ruthenus]|uniref:DNA polymerase kappa-like isoform X1 n=1 Tax=Acipenser ruthenus TaxID=7906 RepID=UPI00274034B3|nr:DNA polymerase kappa-like isoform X1 [Acipenser ruthenus]XP_058848300.1 DNA polymerase kappa-like isoform X1 [Acipenser ruthenus]XP_058848343.1 DNA polymerase kappa-like isoform X1 [Acipenser ruthenus]
MDDTKQSAGRATSSDGRFLSRMALNDNKAGMEGLDKEKINKIILEASKGSRFYENELKKEQQVNQRIEKMLQQKEQITEQQLSKAQSQVEKLAVELERGRELGYTIVHVDMDAFYAAVEMRDRPELRDKPMAVGSMSMLSTSNYHARKFGVRAAMPGFIAKKLCPSLIIVQLHFDKYKAVSAEVREIFADYDPNFLPMSLDEAYLDITEHLEQRRCWPESRRTCYISTDSPSEGGSVNEGDGNTSPVLFEDSPPLPPQKAVVFGISAEEVVKEMRFRIEQRTTLTASAGIAPNMMLAKVCSDKNKPNGQYMIPPDRQAVMDFIQGLPIRKVPGIGKVTEKMLRALGITTCAELYQQGALLTLLFSETSWHHFMEISLGLGSTHIERDGERKSMSTERTFSELSNAEDQYSFCRELCHDLAQDLLKEELKGKTVTLKLKNVNFDVKTRASTVSSVVSTEEEIYAIAKDLLKTEIDNARPQPLRLRLMGVRVSGFPAQEDKKPLQKSIIGFLQAGKQVAPTTVDNVSQDTRTNSGEKDSRTNAGEQDSRADTSEQDSRADTSEQDSRADTSEQDSRADTSEQDSRADTGEQDSRTNTGSQDSRTNTGEQDSRTNMGEQESRTNTGKQDTRANTDEPEGALSFFNKKRAAREQADEQQRQSFFEKVQAQRQRLLETQQARDHGDAPISHRVREDEGGPSSSRNNRPLGQSFTCPVCFQKQNTTNLETFNRHIDECLSGSPVDEPSLVPGVQEGADLIVDEPTKKCLDNRTCTLPRRKDLKCDRTVGIVQLEDISLGHCSTSLILPVKHGADIVTSTKTVPGGTESLMNITHPIRESYSNNVASVKETTISQGCRITSVPSDSSSKKHNSTVKTGGNFEQDGVNPSSGLSAGVPESKGDVGLTLGEGALKSWSLKGQEDTALVCPVCNLKQETTDLSLFNRHVDVCLNQDVIQELREERACSHNSNLMTHRKCKGKPEDGQKSLNSRSKIKRSGSPPLHPVAKKSKAPATKNTIDRFFR